MKNILVLGAGGFIGCALVSKLVEQGNFVRGIDIRKSKYFDTLAHEFVLGDLREKDIVKKYIKTNSGDSFDEIYHFAADMGGADFIFTGNNDADIMVNNSRITLNLLTEQSELNKTLGVNKTKMFYSSSACIYPQHNQLDPDTPDCKEDTAYPAAPDSDYGWEKLFGERLFSAYSRNYNIPVRIGRFHNVYGPGSEHEGIRAKAPAALCRKVLTAIDEIEIYGDGLQTRSFLYIDDAIEAILKLMEVDFQSPMNIGSEEMITINEFVDMIANIENKTIIKKHKLDGPIGVRGRNSNNDLMRKVLNWEPKITLNDGITQTYNFIKKQLDTTYRPA